jgi:hypothetical protein
MYYILCSDIGYYQEQDGRTKHRQDNRSDLPHYLGLSDASVHLLLPKPRRLSFNVAGRGLVYNVRA